MSKRLADLLERSVWTGIQAFFGVLAGIAIAGGGVDWAATFYSAGIAALIAVAKCVAAFQFGEPNSAALPEAKTISDSTQ